MKRLLILILIFLMVNIFACSENQIDVNSASISELDQLYGIGPAKAQAIIDARPYETLDDLINTKGIGPTTLEKIKSQELACIYSEPEEVKKEEPEEIEKINNSQDIINEKEDEPEIENIEKEPIILSEPKIIKSKDVEVNNNNYTIYGLIGFSILLGFLYLAKNIKEKQRYKKNEFKK